MKRIQDLLKKPEINRSRQYELDLLKALAIICMIICHAVMQLGGHRPGCEYEALYIFGDDILGAYIAVAHAFMLAMGAGFVYSRKIRPADSLKRGIQIWLLAYVLNFFRYGIYTIGEGLVTGVFREETAYSLYVPDILQFAGLAMILTALFRKLKLKEPTILVIAAGMSLFGSVAAGFDTGSRVLNLIFGTFVTTTDTESCFALCNWYIFVAVGMFFGALLKRTGDTDRLYRRILTVSGILMVVYLAATCRFGLYFLTKNRDYFSVSTAEAAGLMSIDFFLMAAFHELLRAVKPEKLRVFLKMSRDVTPIYMIHWIILGFLDAVLCYALGLVFSYPVIYAIGILLIPVSCLIADLYHRIRAEKKPGRLPGSKE